MMKTTFPLLLAAILGCASEVDLPLDLDPGGEPPPDMEPEPGPESPPSSPPGTPPDNLWTRTDFPRGHIRSLVWTTDGAVVAATPVSSDLDVAELPPAALTRHGADGDVEWVAHASPTDHFSGLAAIDGGGVVAAIWPDATRPSPAPAGFEWYDADGRLTASWRPSADETGGLLRSISSFRPLPGGSVFWVGNVGLYGASPWVGLLDAERQLQWSVPLTVPLTVPGSVHVDAESAVALTGDGGLVVLARHVYEEPEWPEEPEEPFHHGFLVQLGPDGEERWRTVFGGLDYTQGIAVAPSGSLRVTGVFRQTMSVGDLVLGCEEDVCQFVAEIDPAGEALGLHAMELPASSAGQGVRFQPEAMTADGEELLIAGDFFDGTFPQVPAGALVTSYRRDGTIASETIFVRQEIAGNGGGTGPRVVDVAPDGRLAVGGSFSGTVDFGEGPVDSGMSEYGVTLSRPFIAVFQPGDPAVD